MAKQAISSYLRQDFGIEDFMDPTSRYTQGADYMSMESVDLANALGLLSPIADSNTDTETFAMESANLLGEANQIAMFGQTLMNSAMDRFSIATEIKKNYGVEGFDPFMYGAEGFVDTVKKVWDTVIAFFKKLIQSVSNWIKMIVNWVRSQMAKLQTRMIEKIKDESLTEAWGETVKFRPVKPGWNTAIEKTLNPVVYSMTKGINKWTSETFKAFSSGVPEGAGNDSKAISGLNDQMLKEYFDGEAIKQIKEFCTGKTKFNVDRLMYKSPAKIEMSPKNIFADVGGKSEVNRILGKGFMAYMDTSVKLGKAAIKAFNTAMKTADKLQKSIYGLAKSENAQTYDRPIKDAKARYNANKGPKATMKANRDKIKEVTFFQNISGKTTALLYGVQSAMLSIRTGVYKACKSYMKGKGSPDKPSKKNRITKMTQDRIEKAQ